MPRGLVVVGGGLAGARVVQSYREEGGRGSVVLIAAERHLPYHRPPLTKRILRGEQGPEHATVLSTNDYRDLDVELRLGCRARSLEVDARRLLLDDGEPLEFERLVIATGAHPRKLTVPGAELSGVFTLRTVDDSLAIRAAAITGGRAVVVGTGFIGLEVAASLRSVGVEVTIVDQGSAPFAALAAPPFSAYLIDLYGEKGVEMLLEDGISEFVGDDSLKSIVTASGRTLKAGLAVIGAGVVPATAWLESSGLDLDDGVVVDSSYRTSVDGIYAVGDVARFDDPVFGRSRRIEHWSNSDYQGRGLGRLLAGADGGYDRVSAFFTELFGTSYKFFGDSTGAEHLEIEGDFGTGRAVIHYLEGMRLRAALSTGLREVEETALAERVRRDALVVVA